MININKDNIQNTILSDGKLILGKVESPNSSIYINDAGTQGSEVIGAIRVYGSNVGSNNNIYIENAFAATAIGDIVGSTNSVISATGDGAMAQGTIYESTNAIINAIECIEK